MSKARSSDAKLRVSASAVAFDPDAIDELLKVPVERTLYDAVLGSKSRNNKHYNKRRGDSNNG